MGFQFSKREQPSHLKTRDGFTGGGCGGRVHIPPKPWSGGMQGGCYFHNRAEIYERHNEIRVIVIICHTVSEYHV